MVRESARAANESRREGSWRRFFDAAFSLRCKATGLVVVLTVSVTAAVAGYLVEHSSRLAREQHEAQVVQAAGLLAKGAAVPMEKNDLTALRAFAETSANGQPLLYVIIFDAEGRQLAVAQSKGVDLLQRLGGQSGDHVPIPGMPVFIGGTNVAPVFVDVSYPITVRTGHDGTTSSSQLMGYVRTGMMANTWGRSMASKVDLVSGVGILAMVTAIPLGFLLVRRILAPIDELAEAMQQFSAGKLNVRSSVRRRDEIGRLAHSFNRMADQHQHTHERIVRLNAELEERVAYRTQQLKELASREPLTGLFNRRHFNEVLERRFAEAYRYETDLSCIMIDLDEFKKTNDTFGHHVGDELLMLTANTILNQLRSSDVASRYGGDEFIILLPQTDAERAAVLASRIMEKFKRDVAVRFPRVRVGMSVGVASLQSLDIQDADSLTRAADQALYKAKAAGKNQIVAADEVPKPTLM